MKKKDLLLRRRGKGVKKKEDLQTSARLEKHFYIAEKILKIQSKILFLQMAFYF